MRFRFTVRVRKTVIVRSDGKDADDARSKINFASIEFNADDFEIIDVEPDE